MRKANANKGKGSALSTDEKYAIRELLGDKEFFSKGVTAERFEKAVRQECKRIQRIRARSSYLLFSQLYNFLSKKPSIPDILRKFYNILDERQSFGSIRNAGYAAESLDWVLKDKGEVVI